MILTGESRSTGRKTSSSASWSTTNTTWTVLGSSPSLIFSITKTKLLVLTWESFKTCSVYTFSALEGHTGQCTMNGTAESKTDLLTWRLCAVLRPQNGPLCVHSVAALSGRLTSVKGTHICRLNVEPNTCPWLVPSVTPDRKVGWHTSYHHREPIQLSMRSDNRTRTGKRRRSIRLWQRRRLNGVSDFRRVMSRKWKS